MSRRYCNVCCLKLARFQEKAIVFLHLDAIEHYLLDVSPTRQSYAPRPTIVGAYHKETC